MSKPKTSRRRRVFKIVAIAFLVSLVLVGSSVLWVSERVRTLSFLGTMPACEQGVLHLGGVWGTATVSVELADTKETRESGLMFREELPAGNGMLFAYPEPQSDIAFWMKNTPIPLDILFFDAVGNLRHVHFNAQPYDETPIPGGSDIQYVLEIYSGETSKLGIGPQTTLRHPVLDQNVARWKC